MSDALPLPPRPNLDQYEMLANDLQHACKSGEPGAIRACATRWLETLAQLRDMEHKRARADARTSPATDVQQAIEREAGRIDRCWRELKIPQDRNAECRLADAQFFIAREHGFASWPAFAAHVAALTQSHSPVSAFESAAEAIVSGDIGGLTALLRQYPDLVRTRSTREHRSTLLHYVSANSVEDFRKEHRRDHSAVVEGRRRRQRRIRGVRRRVDNPGAYGDQRPPGGGWVQIALLETLLEHGADIER
jgi:hypothetical protein